MVELVIINIIGKISNISAVGDGSDKGSIGKVGIVSNVGAVYSRVAVVRSLNARQNSANFLKQVVLVFGFGFGLDQAATEYAAQELYFCYVL